MWKRRQQKALQRPVDNRQQRANLKVLIRGFKLLKPAAKMEVIYHQHLLLSPSVAGVRSAYDGDDLDRFGEPKVALCRKRTYGGFNPSRAIVEQEDEDLPQDQTRTAARPWLPTANTCHRAFRPSTWSNS